MITRSSFLWDSVEVVRDGSADALKVSGEAEKNVKPN
jgi:hypothetical protein